MAVAVEAVSSAWSRITVDLTAKDKALAFAAQRSTQNVIVDVQEQMAAEFILMLNGTTDAEQFAALYADVVGGAQRTLATQSRIMSEIVTGENVFDDISVATVTQNTPWVQSASKRYMKLAAMGDESAFDAADEELRGLIASDLQRSVRDGMSARGAVGFIKIPNPAACSWCQVVSDRVYYTRVPWHAHCRCGVIPMPAKYATPEMFIKKELADAGLGWRARDRILTGWRERGGNPMEADAWARDRIAAHTGLKKKVSPTWVDDTFDVADEFLDLSWFRDVMQEVGYQVKQEKKAAKKAAKKASAKPKQVAPAVKSTPVEVVDDLEPSVPLSTEPSKVTPPSRTGDASPIRERRDRFGELLPRASGEVDGYQTLEDVTVQAKGSIKDEAMYTAWGESLTPFQELMIRLYTSNNYEEWNRAMRQLRDGIPLTGQTIFVPDLKDFQELLLSIGEDVNSGRYAELLSYSNKTLDMEEALDALETALRSAPEAADDHYLWRGFGNKTGQALGIEDVFTAFRQSWDIYEEKHQPVRMPLFQGRVFSSDSFLSTSTFIDTAESFGDAFVLNADQQASVITRIARPAGSRVSYIDNLSSNVGEREVVLPPNGKYRIDGITLSSVYPDGVSSWSEWFGFPPGKLPPGFRVDPSDKGRVNAITGKVYPRMIIELTEL